MVSINYSAREVCCKIVFYGPGLSGKTTNLQYVHSKVPGNSRGDLISLATEADRTLYFDFLPINIGTVNGFQAKFQLYTVPGQVYYNATRKLVLRGVDGIVFVADSQPDKMDENIESLVNLEENLKEFGYDIDTIPMVIQYNKRDLPNVLTVEELEQQLNTKGRPHFEASATIGNGVFGTLKLIIKLVLDKAKASATSSKTRTVATAANPSQAEPKVERVPVAPAVSPSAPASAGAEPVAVSASDTQPIAISQVTAAVESVASVRNVIPAPAVSVEPVAQPAVATPAAQAPSVETSPESSSPTESRPFPGSTKGEGAQRKLSSAAFSPSRQDELETSSLSRNVGPDEDQVPDNTLHRVGMMPRMAPPLKQQDREKKRGFFKRLFGIK